MNRPTTSFDIVNVDTGEIIGWAVTRSGAYRAIREYGLSSEKLATRKVAR